MNKDNITDPDNWYYDGPEDGSSLRGGPLASKYMQKVFEDITFRAFGQEGIDRYRENQRVMGRSGK